jgi:hypothetical protein
MIGVMLDGTGKLDGDQHWTEIGDRRSETGGRRQEVGDRRSETGGRRQEVGDRRSE